MARDRLKHDSPNEFRLKLINTRHNDRREYKIPTASEVTGIIVGDISMENCERDVIIQHRTGGLQRISDLHPSFMAL